MATKVLIIAGGLTHERDVSVRSGRRVANILAQFGYEVMRSDVDASLTESIQTFEPDVVWPLVHGSIGEDGSLQSFLESVGVPFVGSSSVQAMLASNKPTAKALLGSAGVATPGWVTLPQAIFRQLGASNVLAALEGSVSFPVVIKPTDGGSALGISTAHNADQLRRAMVDAFAYGQRLMVEQRIDGRDVAVSVVDLWDGPVALPPVEISTDGGRYDYDARYTTDETEYFVPARVSDEILADLQAAAVEAHTTLGLRDLSRIDFVVDDEGTCWFIDANVAPGMTDTSLLPQAADALDDSSFAQLCADIIDFVAEGRTSQLDALTAEEPTAGPQATEQPSINRWPAGSFPPAGHLFHVKHRRRRALAERPDLGCREEAELHEACSRIVHALPDDTANPQKLRRAHVFTPVVDKGHVFVGRVQPLQHITVDPP